MHAIDPKELAMGKKVELEHTKDPAAARKIAIDHLKADKKYYSKLCRAGLVDEPGVCSDDVEKLVKD